MGRREIDIVGGVRGVDIVAKQKLISLKMSHLPVVG